MLSTKPIAEGQTPTVPAALQYGLSVFIPIYNEAEILEANLQRVLEYLSGLEVSYEVLVGSNGSTDATVEIGQRLALRDPRVVFFHLPERGPGGAFTEAVRRARFSCLLTLDADLSFDMSFVPRALEALQDHDAVVGTKGSTQRRPLIRIVASEVFIWFTNLLLGLPYRDYAIGAKAYRTEAIREWLHEVDRHTFYTQQLVYRLSRKGHPIKAIHVRCEDHRLSRFNLLHEGFYRYAMLFGLWYRTRLRPPR